MMKKTFKDNYVALSKKHGGPYSLVSKGIKRGIIESIMRGSNISVDRAHKVAGVLGVSVEYLLTGEEPPTYSPEVQQYVDKLVAVLTGPDKLQAEKVKGFIECLDVAPPLVERKKARASSSMTSKTGT